MRRNGHLMGHLLPSGEHRGEPIGRSPGGSAPCDDPLDEAARRGRLAFSPNSVTAGADYSDDEREFMVALDRYKRQYQRPYPTCCEVLAVLKSLGWRK